MHSNMNDRFLFDLYDADLSGYLSLNELSEGLASAMTNSKLRSSSPHFWIFLLKFAGLVIQNIHRQDELRVFGGDGKSTCG